MKPLCVNIVHECVNLIIAQIMLNIEEGECAAWFGGYGLRLLQARQIIHADNCYYRLTASLNDDMLPLVRNFAN